MSVVDRTVKPLSARGSHERVVAIWDVPVRVFHWALVLSIAVCGISGFFLLPGWLFLHLVAGVTMAGLVAFRLVWGFTGSTYSRFSSFVFSPRTVLAHLQGIANGSGVRDAGHNPLGAAMVFAMLATLFAITASGVAILGGVLKQGPLKSFLSFTTGMGFREVHEILAYVIVALAVLHIAGVAFESARTRENLAASMVTGNKRDGLSHLMMRRQPAVWATLLISIVAAATAVAGTLQLSRRPAMGVPVMVANAAWARECSACHIAFHPSLLPAASWSQIMAGLDDHFGEDASLPKAAASEIEAFLAANAAENWDTLPANRLRAVNAEKPMEITATRFWTRTHEDIPAAAFASKPVGSRNNCEACHADAATGMFAPQSIDIPKETTE